MEMELFINVNKCPHNYKCPVVRVCPKMAIIQKDYLSVPHIDQGKCERCGYCIAFCPEKAIEKK